MRRICIVTGTRAEWGLLSRLAALIRDDYQMELQIIATNMHLSQRYGYTYKEIEQAGFRIDFKVEMNVRGNSGKDTVRSMAKSLDGFAKAYEELNPDMIVVLGDRYEILMAVSAALIFKIPVAHLHGGEITEGAFDDSIRHAVTKMSHLHFASTEEYRQRIIQIGEQPQTVFNFGAIGVDNIKQIPLWSKEETEQSLNGFKLDKNTILVTFHPVTLGNNLKENPIDQLLGALTDLDKLRVIFTMPNSDTGSDVIAEKIKNWCKHNKNRAEYFTSLGLKRYLSTLQYIGAVVGNSSSGIIEAPSFSIPTLNIGDRQKGRIAAQSVLHCEVEKELIKEKITEILSPDRLFDFTNPYCKNNTAQNIYEIIKTFEPEVQKKFNDILSN